MANPTTDAMDTQATDVCDATQTLRPLNQGNITDQFRTLWRSQSPPNLREFVAAHGPMSDRELATLVRADQHNRWRSGNRLPAEWYLQHFPRLGQVSDLAVDVVYAEFLLEERYQGTTDSQAFLLRFPQLQETLKDQFELHGALAAHVPHPDGPHTGPCSAAAPWLPAIPGYDVLGELGRGGMAVVYRAFHRQLQRTVALKVLRDSVGTGSDGARRLLTEAQSAARLQHPHIVQVYEVCEYRGLPYLALEYVDGGTLAEFVRGRPQPSRVAAGMVEILARAAHFAHQQGIVHRDLKPANVLLSGYEMDAGAEPLPMLKIADFGLAKFLERPAGDVHNPMTTAGNILGTASYMSPEQAGGHTEQIAPATDIYALGAILYELLVGRPPHHAPTPMETLLQVVQHDIVPPRRLNAEVPADLETIALKCLSRRPHERFASAESLADDLRRYLDGRPIVSRPVPPWAHAWRWAQRQPVVASLAIAVLISLIGGVIGTSGALMQARRQRDQADKRLAQVEKANEILGSVFRDLNPESERNDGEPLRAVLSRRLDQAARELQGDSIGNDLAVARMLVTLARSYQGLGYYPQAAQQFARARAMLASMLGENHQETLTCEHNLAASQLLAGQFDPAGALIHHTLRRRQETLGASHPDTLGSMDLLADYHRRDGKFDLAIAQLRKTLELRKASFGLEHQDTLNTMNTLALAYRDRHDFDAALPLFLETLRLRRKTLSDGHPDTLTAMNNLAVTYASLGERKKAIQLLHQVLQHRVATLGMDHPYTLTSLNNLASEYREANQLDQSIPLFEDLLRRKSRILGPDHPSTLTTAANLGRNYQEAGRLAEALPMLQRAFESSQKFKTLAWVEPHLAECLANLGMDQAAIAMLHDLAQEARESMPPDSQPLGDRLAQLGWFLIVCNLDAYVEAEPILRESLAIRERLQPEDWSTFNVRSILGEAILGQQRFAEAEPLLLSAYEGMKARENTIPKEAKIRLRDAKERIVRLYDFWEKPDLAKAWRQKPPS